MKKSVMFLSFLLSAVCAGICFAAPSKSFVTKGEPELCPVNRVTEGLISYNYGKDYKMEQLVDADEVFSEERLVRFPWKVNAHATIQALNGSGMMAAKFTVPMATVGDSRINMRGMVFHGSAPWTEANLTMAISPICGNFTPANAACVKSGARVGDGIPWVLSTTPVVGMNECPLKAGETYYLNVKLDGGTAVCNSKYCPFTLETVYHRF